MRRLGPLLLCLAAALAACDRTPPQTDPRATLTRQILDAQTQPLILAILPANGTFSSLNRIGENGPVTTWVTPDGATVSFRDGVVVATRGLGADLMTSDMKGTLAALAGRTDGYYQRFQGMLGGQSEIVYRSFQCRVTARAPETVVIVGRAHATTRTEESCVSPEVAVTNVYWRGTDGTMWKSRQWIGAEIGYLETERLVR